MAYSGLAVYIWQGIEVFNHLSTFKHSTGLQDDVYTFSGSESQCEVLYTILSKENPKLFDHSKTLETALYSDGTKSGFKPLVLLPGSTTCCGRKVIIRFVHFWVSSPIVCVYMLHVSCRNRPSFPVVYTTLGTLVAALYSAMCSECKAIIHHSSWMTQKGDDKVEFFFDPSHSQYIQCTAQSIFETKLLDQLTHQIVHAGATFVSQALVYNAIHGESDEVRLASYVDCF